MSIKCLQQDKLPKLAPAARGLPSQPFITLTELVSFVVWGAPLTSGKSGSLRQCIHEEEAAHRRAPRKERGTAAVSQATARFYGLLSQAVARRHAALWGLKQVGEQPSAVEHERIQPSYLITPRHHDLLDNELHEEISLDEKEMLDRMFDRAARERAARLVRFLDIKISADDAALLVSQYHADRQQPVADSPPANFKVSRSRKWRPLHASIAWSLTRDEQFCTDIAENASAAQRIFCASLQLEHEMIEAGCFNVVNEIMRLDPPTRTVEIQTHRLVPGYTGRFRALAEDYELRGRRDYTDSIAQLPHAPESERNRVSLGDFLLGRWVESFREIMTHVSDGSISARGVAVDGSVRKPAGEMPAACVTDAMSIDLDGVVWEGPQPATSFDEKPRQWIEISVNWDDLLVCFPPHNQEDLLPRRIAYETEVTANRRSNLASSKPSVQRPEASRPEGAAPPATSSSEQKRQIGGHPREYDRDRFVGLLDDLFAENGPIGSDSPDWNSAGKVVNALAEAFSKKHPKQQVPGDTWLKGRVREYLMKDPSKDSRKPG